MIPKIQNSLLTCITFLILIVLVTPSSFAATTVTFEEVLDPTIEATVYGTHGGRYSLISNGMTFVPAVGDTLIQVRSAAWADSRSGPPSASVIFIFPNNGSNYLASSNWLSPTGGHALDLISNEYFSLISVDLAESGWRWTGRVNDSEQYSPISDIRFVGYRSDGTILEKTFTLDWIIDGKGGENDFQTVYFDAEWINLQLVEVYPDGSFFSLDNLNYDNSGTVNALYDPFMIAYQTYPPPTPSSTCGCR